MLGSAGGSKLCACASKPEVAADCPGTKIGDIGRVEALAKRPANPQGKWDLGALNPVRGGRADSVFGGRLSAALEIGKGAPSIADSRA